jgi:hypothetical protein
VNGSGVDDLDRGNFRDISGFVVQDSSFKSIWLLLGYPRLWAIAQSEVDHDPTCQPINRLPRYESY